MATCDHLTHWLENPPVLSPRIQGCEECLAVGDTWVHLRICLTCGHVGCCESSKNKHASKHAHSRGHPLVQSFEPGETWIWCYIDQAILRGDRKLYTQVSPS
ncbi:UBP-type zinc finger domain-containing protein [uncultured Meiothermus sp.]|uniref:UBP-type zinc finger domain-containing protein n=1 Tax=uncultured Meiothermus sp. TaxID=157471 RepID=UPI003454FD09